MGNWKKVCAAKAMDKGTLRRWDHKGHALAIYNTKKGFFATDLMCTHEEQSLQDGRLIGTVIECPLHQARFDVRTGKLLSAMVCADLKVYKTKVKGGKVLVRL